MTTFLFLLALLFHASVGGPALSIDPSLTIGAARRFYRSDLDPRLFGVDSGLLSEPHTVRFSNWNQLPIRQQRFLASDSVRRILRRWYRRTIRRISGDATRGRT